MPTKGPARCDDRPRGARLYRTSTISVIRIPHTASARLLALRPQSVGCRRRHGVRLPRRPSLLVLVTILSYGVLLRPDLAALCNPSMAGVLQAVVGPWGAVFVSIGLLFRSLGHIYRGCSSLRKSSIRLELRHHAALSFPRKQERRSFDGPVAYQRRRPDLSRVDAVCRIRFPSGA